MICGPKIENGVYRRRYNHGLDKELNNPNAYHKKFYSELNPM
jgi:hypothetical protein